MVTMSASSIVCGKSFPEVSGRMSAKIPDRMVGIPRTTIGRGFQKIAKAPTNGMHSVKIRDTIEHVPTAFDSNYQSMVISCR